MFARVLSLRPLTRLTAREVRTRSVESGRILAVRPLTSNCVRRKPNSPPAGDQRAPDDARDLVVFLKTSRGNHTTTYISKLEPADMYIRVLKGNASEDVKVPFLDIYEVQVKHKDLA
jgi:hypothetical protein